VPLAQVRQFISRPTRWEQIVDTLSTTLRSSPHTRPHTARAFAIVDLGVAGRQADQRDSTMTPPVADVLPLRFACSAPGARRPPGGAAMTDPFSLELRRALRQLRRDLPTSE
jgi:hypothetical protein